MKIRITTDRAPWVDGSPQQIGAEIDVSDADGKTLLDLGFAEEIKPAAKTKAKTNV
jgi:hypothetical protein